jgi:glycosyltransferase involved in cell wall biosynthesis
VRQSGIRQTEIIIVDDGSTDGTTEILKSEIQTLVTKLIYHPVNRGMGAALRSGFEQTTGDIVLVQDADLEYDPREYPKLISPIFDHGADVVCGSRLNSSQPHRVLYFWHMVGNNLITCSNAFSNLKWRPATRHSGDVGGYARKENQ